MRHLGFLFLALIMATTLVAEEKVRLTYEGFPYKRTNCEYPSYEVGSTIMLSKVRPENGEGQVVVGWTYKGDTYKPGATFVMPNEDVVLAPVWGDPSEGLETIVNRQSSCRKVLKDGQLIIVRDGVEYNIMGGRVR